MALFSSSGCAVVIMKVPTVSSLRSISSSPGSPRSAGDRLQLKLPARRDDAQANENQRDDGESTHGLKPNAEAVRAPFKGNHEGHEDHEGHEEIH